MFQPSRGSTYRALTAFTTLSNERKGAKTLPSVVRISASVIENTAAPTAPTFGLKTPPLSAMRPLAADRSACTAARGSVAMLISPDAENCGSDPPAKRVIGASHSFIAAAQADIGNCVAAMVCPPYIQVEPKDMPRITLYACTIGFLGDALQVDRSSQRCAPEPPAVVSKRGS